MGRRVSPGRVEGGLPHQTPKKGDLSSCSNYRGITLLSIQARFSTKSSSTEIMVDSHLWDQQAGFHKDRFCTDQTATLHIIQEQLLDWNSPPETLQGAEKITKIIRSTYEGMTCSTNQGGQMTSKDACCHLFYSSWSLSLPTTLTCSPTPSNSCRKRRALLQTTMLAWAKVLKVKTAPITLEGKAFEEVESFICLGSIVDKQRGTDMDVKARIGKARSASSNFPISRSGSSTSF